MKIVSQFREPCRPTLSPRTSSSSFGRHSADLISVASAISKASSPSESAPSGLGPRDAKCTLKSEKSIFCDTRRPRVLPRADIPRIFIHMAHIARSRERRNGRFVIIGRARNHRQGRQTRAEPARFVVIVDEGRVKNPFRTLTHNER